MTIALFFPHNSHNLLSSAYTWVTAFIVCVLHIFRMFCHGVRQILPSDCEVWGGLVLQRLAFLTGCVHHCNGWHKAPANATPTLSSWKNWNRSHLWWLHNNPDDISGSLWSVLGKSKNWHASLEPTCMVGFDHWREIGYLEIWIRFCGIWWEVSGDEWYLFRNWKILFFKVWKRDPVAYLQTKTMILEKEWKSVKRVMEKVLWNDKLLLNWVTLFNYFDKSKQKKFLYSQREQSLKFDSAMITIIYTMRSCLCRNTTCKVVKVKIYLSLQAVWLVVFKTDYFLNIIIKLQIKISNKYIIMWYNKVYY